MILEQNTEKTQSRTYRQGTRFSWKIESEEQNTIQTAYEINRQMRMVTLSGTVEKSIRSVSSDSYEGRNTGR